MLFQYFGYSFFAGFGCLTLVFIINYFIYGSIKVNQKEMLKKKDERMKITTETFNAIKLLKLYNWENEFKNRIYDARDNEISTQKKLLILVTCAIFFSYFAPALVQISTIGLYIYLNTYLRIGDILVGLSIFNRLMGPLSSLPWTFNSIVETFVSMKRIEVKKFKLI